MSTSIKKFRKSKWLGYRDSHLLEICKNKKIVHFGCTDWPYQIEQIANGNLLHSKLINTANSVIGIDVDSEGIAELQRTYKDHLFIEGDISTSESTKNEILKFKPDILLIPDVIEHIENSRLFLSAINELMKKTKCIAVITTPNANSLKTFLPVFFNLDFTHPDHCLLHNEFTITHVLKDSDVKISEINYLSRDIAPKYGVILKILSLPIDLISRFLPRFSDTIIVVTEELE